MKEVPLARLVKERGQSEVASELGCWPSAVSLALSEKRDIRVKVYADGRCLAYEVKPFPSRKPRQQQESEAGGDTCTSMTG